MGTKGEWRNPEDVFVAMPHQGVPLKAYVAQPPSAVWSFVAQALLPVQVRFRHFGGRVALQGRDKISPTLCIPTTLA